ncbi:MAG: diheme cytochrome c-553 [Candidatus Latescibacteria bacterium]|nr:diheme cytochrome c-553 [Candidatus Latescibacterota bacterium]
MQKRKKITLGLLLLAATWLWPQNQAVAEHHEKTQLERGAYLTTILGCHDCHTPKLMQPGPPQPDMSRALSGHPEGAPYPTWMPADLMEGHTLVKVNPTFTAFAGPWGVSFAINLTPDKTGLGEWTEEAFVQALRTGKHQGQPNGRPILPPMPWEVYKAITDDDLKAMWAYLQTMKPIANKVPTPVPPAGPPPGAE